MDAASDHNDSALGPMRVLAKTHPSVRQGRGAATHTSLGWSAVLPEASFDKHASDVVEHSNISLCSYSPDSSIFVVAFRKAFPNLLHMVGTLIAPTL